MDKYYLKYLKYKKKYLELKGAGIDVITIPAMFNKSDYEITGESSENEYDVSITYNRQKIYKITFNINQPHEKIKISKNEINSHDRFLDDFINMAKEYASSQGINIY